jgi:steroid delta-isomerase-like uncharacterized protein
VSVDELIDRWQAAWSGRDASAFVELCAPDLHYEDPLTPDPLQGAAELGAHALQLWDAFPDARLDRTGERLTDGRFVAAPCKLLGTQRRALAGLPPTRRFIVVQCVFYCEIRAHPGLGGEGEERLMRVRAFFDLYDAAVQLGMLPKRGSLGESAIMLLRGFGLRRA